jgi:hypothetical protein
MKVPVQCNELIPGDRQGRFFKLQKTKRGIFDRIPVPPVVDSLLWVTSQISFYEYARTLPARPPRVFE